MERRLAAILAADVVGYSRLMGMDEDGTLDRLKALLREVMQPMIVANRGRIAKVMGDGLLAEFPSVVRAVQCAVDIQKTLSAREAEKSEDQRIALRIGVNVGDIIVEGTEIYGDGVNVAARLETLATPGGVCISGAAFDTIDGKVHLGFHEIGLQEVKNIAKPVRAYHLALDTSPASTGVGRASKENAVPASPKELASAPPAGSAGARSLLSKPSIAVLPFTNMSGDPSQDFLCDGMTEDIITALSKMRWFLVIARNSCFVYRNRSVDVKEVGRDLGARYIVEGSLRRSRDRVRITAQLVDADTGAHHWAETFDRKVDDIFELQDDVTQSVAAAIEPRLISVEGERSRARSAQDLSAWEMVSRAMDHYGRMSVDQSAAAIDLLREAVARYPEYGPAHSMLAFCLSVSNHVGWLPNPAEFDAAAKLATRAVELDNDDPWAHLALGYLACSQRRIGETIEAFKKALALNPNFAVAHAYLGWAYVFDGQAEAAVEECALALRLSPLDPLKTLFQSGICAGYYHQERYQDAVEWGRTAIWERPGNLAGWRVLCASLAMAGLEDEAHEALEKVRALQPTVSLDWIEQNLPYTDRVLPHYLDGMRRAGLA